MKKIELINGKRKCAKCDDLFEPKVYFGRMFSYCKTCQSIHRKKQWEKKKDHISKLNKKSYLKTKYGISIEEYKLLYESQFGECAICRAKQGSRLVKGKSLAIDHCHKTGKVRGLLCQPCNTALGMFNDEIKILKRAIKYLGGK